MLFAVGHRIAAAIRWCLVIYHRFVATGSSSAAPNGLPRVAKMKRQSAQILRCPLTSLIKIEHGNFSGLFLDRLCLVAATVPIVYRRITFCIENLSSIQLIVTRRVI